MRAEGGRGGEGGKEDACVTKWMSTQVRREGGREGGRRMHA